MRYLKTALATQSSPRGATSVGQQVLEGVVRLIIPAANPRFGRFYDHVREWWVEVDEAGVAQREIGFDGNGSPIVAGPIGQDMGFWTDSPAPTDWQANGEVDAERFNAVWQQCETRLEKDS